MSTHTRTHRSTQVSNVACGQQIIDVHQELLVNDLVVCQDEDDGRVLDPRLGVQGQQVCLELCDAIAAAHGDLEDLEAAQEGCQPAYVQTGERSRR